MVNNLIIPTCKGLLDAFHTTVNHKGNMAFLVSPANGAAAHSPSELLRISKNPIEVGSTPHGAFSLGIFSYLYQQGSLKDDSPAVIKLSDLRDFFGLSSKNNCSSIVDRLMEMKEIGAVWNRSTQFNLAKVSFSAKNAVTFQSIYFQKVASHMLEATRDEVTKKRSPFHTILVRSDIVNERNHAAVMIVIELVKLLERRGNCFGHSAHIGVDTLIDRCPELMGKIVSAKSIGKRNNILRNDIAKALELLVNNTNCYQEYNQLNVLIPERFELDVRRGNALVEMSHKGKSFNIKKGSASKNESRS